MAVQIPNEGPLTEAQREDVISAVEGHKLRWGFGNTEISRVVPGVGKTVLHDILKRDYPHATLDDRLRSLNNWIEQDQRRRIAKPGKRPLTTTTVVRQMTSAVEICRTTGKMAIVVGPTGIGKTVTAQELARTIVGTIHITIDQENGSAKKLISELCDRLKVGRGAKRKDIAGKTRWRRAIDQLKDSHRLIILDDADKLKRSGLEMIRELNDATGAPILLIGVVDLWQRILQVTDADHGQLKSRFIIRIDLARAAQGNAKGTGKGTGERRPLFTVDEIRKICSPPKVRLHASAVAYLRSLVNELGQGSFRRALDLVSMAAGAVRIRENLAADEPVSVAAQDLDRVANKSDMTGYDDDLLETWLHDIEPVAKTA